MKFRALALWDVENVFDFYEKIREGLGTRFLSQLEATFTRIDENPHAYAAVYKDARLAPLRRFPYYLIFRVEDSEPHIFAVTHNKRRSSVWKSRVE